MALGQHPGILSQPSVKKWQRTGSATSSACLFFRYMKTRRTFLKTGACAGAGLLMPWKFNVPSLLAADRQKPSHLTRPRLDPRRIPKYVTPLVVPPAMPRTAGPAGADGVDYYEIAVRQFRQRVLPHTFPETEVWGYGSVNRPLKNDLFYGSPFRVWNFPNSDQAPPD